MLAFLVLVFAALFAAALGFGRWSMDRASLSSRLERGRERTPSRAYEHDEIWDLPPPVARYFEAALTPGRPFIEQATLFEEGRMRTGPTSELTFRAITRVTVRRPGFVSESRVAGPFGVHVIDAYADGQGSLDVAAFAGVLPMLRLRRCPGLAESQLQRWLAEAPWYPTALLPRAGVRWEAVDETSARATIADGLMSATLLFRFGSDALVASVHAEERGRWHQGRLVRQPWEGRFTNPVEREGYVVPHEAIAAWVPSGTAPEIYWWGTMTGARYD